MRRLLVAVVVVLASALVPAAVAQADVLIFTCGTSNANLCQSAPDGSSRSMLTNDATGSGNDVYASPSLSANGSRLAFLRRGQLYVTDASTGKTVGPAGGPGAFLVVRLRGDGARLAVGELSVAGLGSVCTYAADLSGRTCIGAASSFGWGGSSGAAGILASVANQATGGRYAICLERDDPSVPSGCASTVLTDPAADLYDAVASPDGTQIAVTRAAPGSVRGSIAIYSATTGSLVRVLTAGPDDGGPAWSPDGRAIAFDRSGAGVMTVSASAARPGTEALVDAGGREPTWGGGTIDSPGCTMPRLVGKRLAAARTALQKAHCAAPSVTGSPRSTATVTRQSPAPGRTVASGKRPTLTTKR